MASGVLVEEAQGLVREVLEGRAVVRPEFVGVVPGSTCVARGVAAINNRCRNRCRKLVAVSAVARLLLRHC